MRTAWGKRAAKVVATAGEAAAERAVEAAAVTEMGVGAVGRWGRHDSQGRGAGARTAGGWAAQAAAVAGAAGVARAREGAVMGAGEGALVWEVAVGIPEAPATEAVQVGAAGERAARDIRGRVEGARAAAG